MSLTREDTLRELELLPVWQLRMPAPKVESATEPAPSVEAKPEQVLAPSPQPVEAPALRMIVSDDASYLFLLAPLSTAEEETLLQNMLKAMQVKPRVDIGLQSMQALDAETPKVLIALGDTAAQSLLNLTESVETLRGKLHQHNALNVVATYHPNHLLSAPSDKAKAWQDLCLAMAHVASLESASF